MRIRVVLILLCCSLYSWGVRFSDEAKRNCQLADEVLGTVTLIFATDSAHFAVSRDSILSVWVSGSINDLQDTAAGYQLDQWSEDSCFYHTFTCEELAKPGNSGQPEFVFYVQINDSTGANYYGYDLKQVQMDDRLLCYNGIPYTMIVMPCGADYFTTDLDELGARCEEAKEVWSLEDFDLTDSVDQHRISNFRRVPGTQNLYRSYHPYYPSNPKYDTEQQRLYWVATLAAQVGVQSAICLTSDLSSYAGQRYACGGDSFEITIPSYMQALMMHGDLCNVGKQVGKTPSVVACYYHSDEEVFATYMQAIVSFISDARHPLPMQIHCSIGADRTGMVCAVIAALCGADWEDILADYQATGDMKIQTYRHPNRLRYALNKMTGIDVEHSTKEELASAIRAHLVKRMQVLTDAQIDKMIERLTLSKETNLENGIVPHSERAKYYDVLGHLNSMNHPSVQVRIDEQGKCTKLVVMP